MSKYLNNIYLPQHLAKGLTRTIGLIALIFGLWNLFSAINLIINGNKFYESLDMGTIDLLNKFNFQILADIGFIITGWGLLRLLPWARYFFFISIVIYFVPSLFYSALFYGQMIALKYYLLHFFTLFGFSLFFSIPQVKEMFPFRRPMRDITTLFLVIFIYCLGIWLWMFIDFKMYQFSLEHEPKFKKLKIHEPNDFSEWDITTLPIEFSFEIPKEMKVSSVVSYGETPFKEKLQKSLEFIHLTPKHVCSIGLKNFSFIEPTLKTMESFFESEDKELLTDILFDEKIGVQSLVPRMNFSRGKIKKHLVNGIVVYSGENPMGNDGKISKNFILFRHSRFLGRLSIYCGERIVANALINQFFKTLSYQAPSKKSSIDFFREGQRFLKIKNFEKAAQAFGSALFLEPENAEYHLALADALSRVDLYFITARMSLDKALELDPNIKGHEKISERIRIKGEEHDRKFKLKQSETN
ncbi:MAG: tetratricopeptide repeat protein [Candidatus Nitronauta litoralis]|uniref:Tetratricopeptide repeat protein n=1 Tax=Candidatus Nitronauta litoralis TaxID=2705533 RepID=A0A7T0BW73_9BACT|nr:MAG: tetratricopeptide repeat protein [Candidatus Nitronauta litoralis]